LQGEKHLTFPTHETPARFREPIIELQDKLDDLREHPEKHSLDISFEEEIQLIEKKTGGNRRQIFFNLNAWQRVQLARASQTSLHTELPGKDVHRLS